MAEETRLERVSPLFLLLLFLMAFAVRATLGFGHDVAQSDSASYFQMARYVDAPENFEKVPFRIVNPVYPLVVLGVLKLPLDPALAARLANALLGALNVIVAFYLGRRIGGIEVGRLTGVLMGAWYLLVLDSVSVMTEPLFTFFTMIHLLVLHRWSDRPSRLTGPFFTGVTAGLALLTRGNGVVYVPLTLTLLAFGWRGFSELSRKRRVVLGLVVVVVAGCFWATPRMHVKNRGEEFPNTLIYPFHDGTNLALTNREEENYRLTTDGEERAFKRFVERRSVGDLVRSQPGRIARKYALNMEKTLNETIPGLFIPLTPLLLPLAAIGLARLYQRGARSAVALIALYTAPWVVLMPLIQVRSRHFFAILPLWIVAVATTLAVERGDSPGSRRLKRLVLAISVAAMLASLGWVAKADRTITNDARFAGSWIRKHDPGAKFMARDPEIEIHAGTGNRVFLPYEELPRILEFARRQEVDYLIVEKMARRMRPQLAPLLEPDLPPELAGEVELATRVGASADPVLIFRILRR